MLIAARLEAHCRRRLLELLAPAARDQAEKDEGGGSGEEGRHVTELRFRFEGVILPDASDIPITGSTRAIPGRSTVVWTRVGIRVVSVFGERSRENRVRVRQRSE